MRLKIVTGPCVIENEKATMEAAEWLTRLFENRPVEFVFKSSYDKANRTSLNSFRGPGLEKGLKILERVRATFKIPIFTDVHSPQEALEAAEVCDIIQIPAFLCRQTDLLLAAGRTGKTINVKKGQFVAPWDMGAVIEKIRSTGNENILLTERGFCFGYNNLVSDMRSIPIMQKLGYPVLFDATHSVQLPSGQGVCSGGEREFVKTLSFAALAAGCDGIYAEAHPNPEKALCDAACMLPFSELAELVDRWEALFEVVRPCSSGV
ncbi:MAG: 3-deoxy-8-phosphooctulonate synthase [Verrucomicrobia bacterium]|nr:3-deoxy-8-phosphooctulonate synthase [Verrucomicrobiota bacterium]